MNDALIPRPFILITLVMLFISGCWTIASIISFPIKYEFRVIMTMMVTASNVAFLLSLLASVLSYEGMGNEEKMKRVIVYSFSIGIFALVISVIMFSLAYITTAPRYD